MPARRDLTLPPYINKDALKRELPLAYACHRLGIHLDVRSGHALCPFHADSRPSFHLWQGDDKFARWGCYPCGLTGDVYELIQRVENVSFWEAVTRAHEFLQELGGAKTESYPQPAPEPPTQSAADWVDWLVACQQRAAQPDWAGRLCIQSDFSQDVDHAWDDYLRGLFWGITIGGDVVMPHYKVDDSGNWFLTGVKIREPGGRRNAKEGSRWPALYGQWQLIGGRPPHPRVLLTEGETDTAWAGYRAKVEELDLTVMGLPGGATAEPGEEQIEAVKHAREIYLAFDPDRAGIEATRSWVEALDARDKRRAVKICRLPLGRDLRECQPQISQMLQFADAPLRQPGGIRIEKGVFVAVTDESEREICPWAIDPVAELQTEHDPGFEVELHTRGRIEIETIRYADFTNVRKFKDWTSTRALVFTGSDRDVNRIAEHIVWRGATVPQIFQADRVGMMLPPPAYSYAPPTVLFPGGYHGQIPWTYVVGPQKSDVSGQVLLPDDGGDFRWEWLKDFLELSHEVITCTMLAWLCAAARRPEVQDFPLLFISGPSGTGKSTLAKLLLKMGGSAIELGLGSVTPYLLTQRLASTTSIPILVDEWTTMSKRESREALQGMIPDIYQGGTAERGQANLTTIRYPLTAPVILAGEDTLQLDRERDRVVAISPKKQWQNAEALERIATVPLERFGSLLHWYVCSGSSLPILAPPRSPNRQLHNRRVLQGGWDTLLTLLDRAHELGFDVPQLPATLPDESQLPQEEADEESRRRDEENVYEKAVHECYPLKDQQGNPIVWPDPEGRGTWVRFDPLLVVGRQALELQFPGKSRAALDYFRSNYRVEGGRHRSPTLGVLGPLFRCYLIHGFHVEEQHSVV